MGRPRASSTWCKASAPSTREARRHAGVATGRLESPRKIPLSGGCATVALDLSPDVPILFSVSLEPLFHPAVAAWFSRSFAAPTAAQAEAWPAIKDGRHVLIAAPTGSGKTLAAFLAAIDGLVRQGLPRPPAPPTPTRPFLPPSALSPHIHNTQQPPLPPL